MSSPSTQSSGGLQTASSTPITCSSSTETLNSPSGALSLASQSPSVGGTPTPSVAGPPTPVGPTSPLFYRTPNPAPGSTQQPPSAPVMRFPPPQSPAALQPPVPGQSSSTRPSFSYNVSSSSCQQATTSGHLSGGKLTPPTTATLQSTVAGQPIHQNPSVPGAVAPCLQTPTHPPFSASTGQASTAESFSFNSSSQLPTTTEDLHKHSSSNSSTADVAASETRSVLPTSAAPHSASFPVQTSNVASLSGIPGPPGIALSAPLPSMSAVRPAAMNSSSVPPRPTFPSVVSSHTNAIAVGVAPNVAQMIYPPYSSYAAMPQPPQTFWLPPNQVSGFQRPQFLPYPGAVPSPFPVPLYGGHGGPLPSMPIPEPQPPGVSSVVQPPENSSAIAASTQPAGFKAQSPPPGIDYAKEAKEIISKSDEISKKVDADAWTAHKSETGAVYYYNAVTGESTYQKPSSFIGEADKVTVQPTPVSWEKLAGTDWVLVATNDGKKYYYNSKSKISSWQVPPEVAELRKKQDADSAKANATSAQQLNLGSLDAPAVITGGRDAVSLRSSVAPMSSSQVELVKKKLHDASTPVTSSPVPASSAPLTSIDLNDPKAVEPTLKGQHSENSKERPKDAGGDGNVSESSSDADDVDSGPKKDDYIFQFKEMLKERGVAPFSKWDKELPKILFDPRFKAVPGYDTRKALFEQFVKTRAEEERKEKRAAQKAAVEGFKHLLEEASEVTLGLEYIWKLITRLTMKHLRGNGEVTRDLGLWIAKNGSFC
ncbi:Pre-mRNA-processing protein 40C [Acorus calamus]|uniref:Pre-mRNA-processing protein 40C n=1 Tax=Acorus calamus TaxID=4465 RepID=A0AAV9DWR6_ACOCL|nr:Pre-mRNA-processing protein 40C [Acorus calamus]